MKRILRILVGLPLSPLPMLLATWVWLFEEGISWWEAVGENTWNLASGQWDKLSD